jgi:hypothetical protein
MGDVVFPIFQKRMVAMGDKKAKPSKPGAKPPKK